MDSLRELVNTTVLPMLQPEPIPAQIKVIMVGSDYNYALLNQYDEEFDKFFKIRADFDYEMPRNSENITKIAQFIKGFVDREKTLEFDVSAVCAIVEYSSRSVSRQDKLSTRFNHLSEILGEAHTWAMMKKAPVITAAHIRKAIAEKEQRLTLYKEKLDEMLESGTIMIDTEGAKIGQINDLAVLDMGSFSFGTPTRITATTYMGKSGIVNLLTGKEKLASQFDRLMKRYMSGKLYSRTRYIISVLNDFFHKYIVGQCTEAVILGALCTVGMLIFGFPYASMTGAVIAFTSLIPVAGGNIGAAVGAFMILTVSPMKALLFLIYIVILQQPENNLIYPKVVGSSMGLPAIWVVAAATIGGGVLGIAGMLISVPVAAAVYRLISEDVNRISEKTTDYPK